MHYNNNSLRWDFVLLDYHKIKKSSESASSTVHAIDLMVCHKHTPHRSTWITRTVQEPKLLRFFGPCVPAYYGCTSTNVMC